MFIRSNFLLGSFNFERVQAMGYCYVMIPAIKRLYGPGAQRNAALKRHLEWFNTHPWISAPNIRRHGSNGRRNGKQKRF